MPTIAAPIMSALMMDDMMMATGSAISSFLPLRAALAAGR